MLRRRKPEPDSWDYLFVITYGRSGSTLLQAILNSIPGYAIRGENGGAVKHLWRFHREMTQRSRSRRRALALPRDNPWWGIDGFDESLSAEQLRGVVDRTILRPPPGTRVTGFKEVRYLGPDTPDYVMWLADTFPGARFVFNSRNLDDVVVSDWWRERADAREFLDGVQQMQDELRIRLGERAFDVRYDDYTADPAVLAGLFVWLGEPFDRSQVESVLSRKHGY
ncbi:MAG: sulfotransferase [Candidatus Nanopelagicales bacterium]